MLCCKHFGQQSNHILLWVYIRLHLDLRHLLVLTLCFWQAFFSLKMNCNGHVLFLAIHFWWFFISPVKTIPPRWVMMNLVYSSIYMYIYVLWYSLSWWCIRVFTIETLCFDFLDIFGNHQLDVHFSLCYHTFTSITTYALTWQVYLHKKQSKHQNLSEGKRKDRFTENGGGFHHFPNPKQFADVKLPFGDSSCQVLATSGIRRQEQSVGSDSLCYSHIPYTHSNYIHPSDQFPVSPTPSCVKSENNGHSPFSPKESSYASNIQSMESSHDASFETPAIKVDEKREKLYRKQGFQTSFAISSKHKDLVVQAACYDPISVQKQLNHSENEVEGHSEVEGGSISIPMEMDSSNVQDNSCMSSMLEEISLEATSFRQLQNVTEQVYDFKNCYYVIWI